MNKLVPLWRIYIRGKPMKHLGNVEASSEAEALERAVKGSWEKFWATEAEQPSSAENLVAML